MSANISKYFIERWEKIRERDRINYSLIYAIFFSIVFTLFKDWDLIIEAITNDLDLFNQVIRNCLTVFVWAGYGFYILFWVLENVYLKIVPDVAYKKDSQNENSAINPMSFDDQIKVFNSLGYFFNNGVTKEMILRDIYEMTSDGNTNEYIENNPFSELYFAFGWRSPEIGQFNYSEKCIWYDLEFFDPNSQYKWFMERMGAITNGEIKFEDIEVYTDQSNWEWIKFKVNGISKNWKLEKSNYIADHFIQRFAYLTDDLKTKGRYTYYDNGGQQFMIDYATEEDQRDFIKKTGLKREWLGEKAHFSDPKD